MMHDVAPEGVVTLVFTDIESSAVLWNHFGEGFPALLAVHDAVLRQAAMRYGGYEVHSAGDGFLLAFSTASSALRFCLDVQQELQEATWPDALVSTTEGAPPEIYIPERGVRGVRVRIGVHTGEPWIRPDPTTGRMNYGGPMCNTASRIGAAAHGGQVVVSDTTWSARGDVQLDGAVMLTLGEHALRGIEDPIRLYQLLPASLPSRVFPRLVTADRRKTNLTHRVDSFIGRDTELRALEEGLAEGGRQITVVGSAGAGKTRLVQRFGILHLDRYPGGVWFCDLANARTVEDIATVVATALDVAFTQADPIEQLGHAIASRGRMLLILDTFEKVRDLAGSTLMLWHQRAPDAQFLVTSQARLRVDGERLVTVDPLDLSEAVQLFEDRARSVLADFRLSDDNRGVVTEIVEQLDRMALAVELAAARVGVLPPISLMERLNQRFELLRGQGRKRHSRQTTLRGAIDWSWSLLEPWEQLSLAQCTVFRGGFTLEAAEAVIDVNAWPDAPWPIDVVQSLLDKCLLRAWEPYPGQRRFFLLQSVHAYAEEKLGTIAECATPQGVAHSGIAMERHIASRHAAYFGCLGTDESVDALDLRSGLAHRRAVSFEVDNLLAAVDGVGVYDQPTVAARCARAAMRILQRTGPYQRALNLFEKVGVMGRVAAPERARLLFDVAIVFRLNGHLDESRTHLEKALHVAEELGDLALQGQVYGGLGRVLVMAGHMDIGYEHSQRGIELCRRSGNRQDEGVALSDLAIFNYEHGDVDRALMHFEQALIIARDLKQWSREAMVLNNLAVLFNSQGRTEEGMTHSEAALAIHRELGEKRGMGLALNTLAILQRNLGHHEASRASLNEALAIFRELGDRRYEGMVVGNLGEVSEVMGDVAEAERQIAEAIRLSDQSYPTAAGAFRGQLAVLLARRGDLDGARELLGQGDTLLRGVFELELGKLVCKRGEVEHLAGDAAAAQDAFVEAEAIATRMKVGPGSELHTLVEGLRAILKSDGGAT